ncbi:uncharacterized protein LOC754335 [Strongylocentrotus purpuratus]|uniref:Uncharacterized protein n=1 Tax=Strongylocentrotus purpuratus TaxID=7668 RepID=A0A7M7NQW2_STRPU|nr:uncharacterized protein LOC754335 [Strongylocentrotus purpuratus]
MKSPDDNPLPDDMLRNVEQLKALTIHPTIDRLAPAGLGKAIEQLTNLKTLDLVGNSIHCDCALPKALASQNILLLSKSRMPPVKGCKRHGFSSDLYNIQDFLEKCAEREGYELQEPPHDIMPQVPAGLSNRRFGNIRDQNLFNRGITYNRINSSPMQPSAAKRVPGAFSGVIGKPPSGGLSAFGRKKPSFSASTFASRFSKARHQAGRWGRRRLLSLDEVDIDPASSEAIATAQGEEKRQKRQATTWNRKRRRRPIEMLPGMSVEDFINAHKRRGRGRKMQNGWTELSGGWRYRDVRSVGGENSSDSFPPLEVTVPPNGQSQQKSEEDSQEVSLRRWGSSGLLSLDEVDIDPAFSKATATAQGEEKRQKRQATTWNRKRRRRPIEMLPGMSVEDFINAHHRRGRGRKTQNGWTQLSGGWRYRDVRSVGGENSSDSFFPLELTVSPNGQSQQKSEEDSQEVSLRRWGGSGLSSLDEVDIDPAFSKATATAQGEEKRQKRQATTWNRKRRRRPIEMLPGMSVEDFINAHKRRGRGRNTQNGWTQLSGGWRYRDVRSVGGENSSDSFFPLELTVPPNGQSQQKSEEDSQEVSLRRWGGSGLSSLDEVDIDPAFSKATATAQGEEKRQKRQATTWNRKRRRRPIEMLPGMSVEDFINAHHRRGRGRKTQNGWTQLSGGWRYRDVRSVGGENSSDSFFPLELPVPPNGQSQQKSEEDSQEVSLRRWGGSGLSSLDEVDIDPVFSKATATAQGEERRQKRQATTWNRKRRRRPIEMLPGMSVEDFINAHHRRGRGRKTQNGWTQLSGGWRYRDVRSVGGENSSDSFFPLELPVPPNGQSQQKSEDDSQEVSLRSKRNIVRNDLGSMLGRLRQRKGAQPFQKKNLWTDQYVSGQRRRGERSTNGQNITNTAEYPLTVFEEQVLGETPNQSPTGNVEQQYVNLNVEDSRGEPTDAVQLERPVPPPVEANPGRRAHPHPPGQGKDHRHRHLPDERARQLAMYQLPMNDLTLKLNPFDPFEVDLFFQYILHNENLPENQELPRPQ